MPTSLFPSKDSEFMICIALFKESASKVPNPSSIKIVSTCIPPFLFWITSLNPNARDNAALNDSPPDNDLTFLLFPVHSSRISNSRPEDPLFISFSSFRSR